MFGRRKSMSQRSPAVYRYRLIATSIDHPGILHQICKSLQTRKVNIDDISTNMDDNPMTGEGGLQEKKR